MPKKKTSHGWVIRIARKYATSAENTRKLLETDQTLIEGLNPNAEAEEISRNQARGRQLRAKMITELIEIDENRGNDCTRLRKEMVGTIAATRDTNFSTLSDYLVHRVVDAGLP